MRQISFFVQMVVLVVKKPPILHIENYSTNTMIQYTQVF